MAVSSSTTSTRGRAFRIPPVWRTGPDECLTERCCQVTVSKSGPCWHFRHGETQGEPMNAHPRPAAALPPAGPASSGLAAAARAVAAVKIYGHGNAAVRVLDGVMLELAAGRFTAIMGPSGSGKSTLLHCLAALDSLTSGRIFLGETELG